MIKVLQVSKRYPPYIGGIERTCHDISLALQNDGGFDVRVIAFNDEKTTTREKYDGIAVTRVGLWRVVASQPISFDFKKELYSLIKDFNPDVIHFHYPNPFAAHYLIKGIRKFGWCGKIVLHWHADIIKQKFLKIFFDHQNKTLLEMADKVVVTSPNTLKNTSFLPKFQKDYIVLPSRVGEERLSITEDQRSAAEAIRKKHPNKRIIFFYGRHVKYKGLEYLIKSAAFLPQDKVAIIIGGEGPLTKKLKRMSKKFDCIEFAGRLSEPDINANLLACDIFAFPSITRNEAFGLSLAEASFFGKPSCTFEILGSGVNWVSIKNVTGLEAPNKDIRAFSENLKKLIIDGDERTRLGNAAKERATLLFTKEAFNKNVLNLYHNLQ